MDKFMLIFIIIIIYILAIFIIRKLRIGRKISSKNCNNCCPDCGGPLKRIRRKKLDHFLHHITFRTFDHRRYICDNCGWEGLRWEDKFRPGLD